MPTENLDSALKAGELIEETAAARESAKNDLNLVLDNYASILKKREPVDTIILGEIVRIRQAMESTTGIIPEEDYENISTAAGSPISREAYDELIRLGVQARLEYGPFMAIPLVSAYVGANVLYDTYAEIQNINNDILDKINEYNEHTEDLRQQLLTAAGKDEGLEGTDIGKLFLGDFSDTLTDEEREKLNDLLDSDIDEALEYWQEVSDFSKENLEAGRQKEQCYLLSNIFSFTEIGLLNELAEPREAPYSGDNGNRAVLLNSGPRGPFALVNRLTEGDAFKSFYNIKTSNLSQLQPMIRLYKIYTAEDGSEYEAEIPFNNHVTNADLARLLESSTNRGYGAGIKSFDLEFDGNNFFTAKKSLKANLVLFFDSFDQLLLERNVRVSPQCKGAAVPTTEKFRYVDLVLRTPSAIKKRGKEATPAAKDAYSQSYKIKAVMGYAMPSNTEDLEPRIVEAIKDSYITLTLLPVGHDISIDDAGLINFDVEYRAFMETTMNSPFANVLVTPETKLEELRIRENLEKSEKLCSEKLMKERKKDLEEHLNNSRQRILNNIITKLRNRNKIFSKKLTAEEYRSELKNPWESVDSELLGRIKNIIDGAETDGEIARKQEGAQQIIAVTDEIEELLSDDIGELSDNQLNVKLQDLVVEPDSRELVFVNYFFLGDLVDVVLQNIHEVVSSPELQAIESKYKDFDKQFRKTRILLSDMEIGDPKNNFTSLTEAKIVNLADVPISIPFFVEWFIENVVKPAKETYSLTTFLSDIMGDMLVDLLQGNGCFSNGDSKQRVHVNVAQITAMNDVKNKIPTKGLRRLTINTVSPTPLLQLSPPGSISPTNCTSDEFNYIIFYVSRVYPYGLNGKKSIDETYGIPHFDIGQRTGIVKTIKFNKTDQPFVKEARFEQEGADGLAQLREAYNVDMSLFGNPRLFPGQYIYVNPFGISPFLLQDSDPNLNLNLPRKCTTYAARLGIGGYHMITKVNSSIEPGSFETNIVARWVAQGDDECRNFEETQNVAISDTGDEKIDDAKCPNSDTEPTGLFGSFVESVSDFVGVPNIDDVDIEGELE